MNVVEIPFFASAVLPGHSQLFTTILISGVKAIRGDGKVARFGGIIIPPVLSVSRDNEIKGHVGEVKLFEEPPLQGRE